MRHYGHSNLLTGISRCALLITFALLSAELPADTLRCGHRVVDQGMPAEEVRQLCGEPTTVEEGGRVWTYDFGAGQNIKVIMFVQDKVEFIDERPRD